MRIVPPCVPVCRPIAGEIDHPRIARQPVGDRRQLAGLRPVGQQSGGSTSAERRRRGSDRGGKQSKRGAAVSIMAAAP